MVSRQVRTAAVAAAAVTVLAAGPAGAAGPAHRPAPPARTVGYFSYTPSAAAGTVRFFAERPLAEGVSTRLSALPDWARSQLPGRSAATPRTGTPHGYKLRRGNRSTDYVYRSADVYAIEAECGSGGCRPVQQVKVAIKEYVRGRTSKKWEITFYGSRWSGSTRFHLDYTYDCGVNIAHAPDSTCSTWRRDGAQGHGSGVAVDGQRIVKNFGSTAVVTRFPMVKLLVTFADGSRAIGDDGAAGEKFRGWDVCATRTTTRLCHRTGDGS
ncbi:MULTISPECIES: hypothetical protein [unclassified Streptomyces]|uniref:Uncharacterized protein n=1 Tax=Streptomyces doudnae TaxID=3075536 RepID=A0ABD5EPF6_9ACTN|nr:MULTISPECIES: hypothetical protein [unclassified Streptomyces]MDT0436556.1 hypothetical protein [Streptomyces sp. DSM 41981]MYQ63323.1 hypothetical protein [Streptomyces sp. SID4950]SCD55991.1 hypothetical protein GA0115242_109010 [Streptomyces sp. SolWspMP-5a-2]